MKNILVIRLSAIGDVLLTTPVLARLRKMYPAARIHFLVKERYTDFIAASPDVDELITWKTGEGILDVKKKLSGLGVDFDLLLDLQSNLKTRILSLLVPATLRRRYHKPYLDRLLLVYLKKNRYKEKKKISERYLDALQDADAAPLTETVTLKRGKLLKPLTRFAADSVLIAPGARWATKRWPAEYFVSLASKILEKHPGKKIIWLGGPDEKELFEFFSKHPYLGRHAKRMLFLVDQLDVTQMAALADIVVAIVCNDSGLMHLLSTAKTPLIALFLSTVEEFGFFPLGGKAQVLYARDIPCRPCNHKGLDACPKKHFRCGRELTADQVYGEVVKHLRSNAAPQVEASLDEV
ncbi:MAG: glycosyltransferase family 9 protein [Spirochaetes bacterium]|nr:glycosyltransferase family 9 protein [Spirochaetota bacterium]